VEAIVRECDYNQHISTEPHALSSVGAGWVSVKVPTSSWGGRLAGVGVVPPPLFRPYPHSMLSVVGTSWAIASAEWLGSREEKVRESVPYMGHGHER